MAASPLNVQPSFHARSNSLPSKQHLSLDENLPLTQQALAQEKQRKVVDELWMDLSCSWIKGVEGLANEVRKYLTSRKAARKAISKALKNLKHMENKLSTSSFSRDGESGAAISSLKQVEAVTISVLESLLSYISRPRTELKSSRWSLVSKLMHQKRVLCEEVEQKANEIENAEAALHSMIKSGNMKNVGDVQNKLQNSEMCIQDLEEGLESFFRRLIKARVNVLNILNC
ncbi:putative Eukaryotic translation initiation factor 3 subunit A [Hibiscus syriacus]|uniref:Eukaryotic translation initiation factor 3 subunit A n=1 Tax=Hibiscus syriacus TaxID=106335 RepID=A0A6A3CB40_HIBSY|nr:putative Eukaryotic translation initiation factor 3 subunit A [Hibiscus syriacus]